MSQTNEPPKKSASEVMRGLRLMQLTVPPQAGEKPTAEFPQLRAVLMDWPIDVGTVTVVARATGDASLYTTGTFGVIGGVAHESVRRAAKHCVQIGGKYSDKAATTQEFPYPKAGQVRFYLVGYDGVRVLDADLASVNSRKGEFADLYEAAHYVIAELRLTIQEKEKKTTPQL